jgi:hypothetical protein
MSGGNPITLVDPSGLSPTEGARISQAQIVQFQQEALDIAIGFALPTSKVGNLLNGLAKGIVAKTGLKVEGFTGHGVDRAIGNGSDRAGVSPQGILDALKNPLKIGDVKIDQLGRQSQRFIGEMGEVVVNPQTGKIISVNPTSTSKAARLRSQLESSP